MRRWTAIVLLAVPTLAFGMSPRQKSPPSGQGPLFAESWVPVEGGLQLYARVVGQGPATVIVPGAAYLVRDFARLADRRTLIFYDPRSRGGSDLVLDGARLGLERDIEDLEAVRAHFGVGRVSVVGFSYLGVVVALYAAKYSDHVERVVQIGPAAPRSETATVKEQRGSVPNQKDLEHLEKLRQGGTPTQDPVGYCRQWLKLQLLPSMMGRPEAVSRTSMDPCIYSNEWPDRVFRSLRLVWPPNQPDGRWDFTRQAAQVRAPVLIVHGTRDPAAPIEAGRDWAAHIPKVRLIEFDGVGHFPWLEAPDRFFAEVETFLQNR
jgi:proline iminopeptidase